MSKKGDGDDAELSHYRSVFDAIERRVVPEVEFGRATPLLIAAIATATLGFVLPLTGSAHGYDVLLRTASAEAESAGALPTLFMAFSVTFTVAVAVAARAVRRFRWAGLALAGNGLTTVLAVLAIWSRQSLTPDAGFAGPAIGLYLGAAAALVSTALWARAVFTHPHGHLGGA
ncbi:Hypothetical membrane protein [Rhodococcus sp. AW25M09]|uniref:Rv2732c family membrane protein n=1 Tax=Rhodococcus sp. AW25M09 TaxID=1268303 RepID=UPI0002AD11ED|nr:hypothetical protein [Rhodococcus sp. AW25M09]CCQ14292.1 Hypothetical membrane protein [Rhodococcus sp. AW25M09]